MLGIKEIQKFSGGLPPPGYLSSLGGVPPPQPPVGALTMRRHGLTLFTPVRACSDESLNSSDFAISVIYLLCTCYVMLFVSIKMYVCLYYYMCFQCIICIFTIFES